MNRRAICPQQVLWLMLAVAIAAPVWAHHSAAGYDMAKTLSSEATIKEFRWGAPHSSAVFMVKGPDGKVEAMTVAAGSPAMFVKQGFQPRDFQVGDKVQITWHPSISGHPGGMLASVKFPNGRVFKDVEFAPGVTPGEVLNQADTAQ